MMRVWRCTIIIPKYPMIPMRETTRLEIHEYMTWLQGRFGPLPSIN